MLEVIYCCGKLWGGQKHIISIIFCYGGLSLHINNSTNRSTERVITQLESAGFRAALMPYSYISKISEIYDSHKDNSESTPYQTVNRFRTHQPPDISFEPLSFLVIANKCKEAEIILNYKGTKVSIPIPPIYLDNHIKQRLKETLKTISKDYHLSDTAGVSLKLLAVLSGLGKYGHNMLCYIDEFGSYCNLEAYYTDIPCQDNEHKVTSMKICETCGLCIKNCPTSALGGERAIDVSRCLTMQNEFDSPIPDWLSSNVHHALIGCMRCQEVCPINKSIPPLVKEIIELNEDETEAFLESTAENLPKVITEKLLCLGFFKCFINVVRRNAKLVIMAQGL